MISKYSYNIIIIVILMYTSTHTVLYKTFEMDILVYYYSHIISG